MPNPPDNVLPVPLFIVGMQRSGTKLLRAFLSNHSKILLTSEEMEFLPYLLPRLPSFGNLREHDNFLKMYSAVRGFLYFTYLSEKSRPVLPDLWHQAFVSECEHQPETDTHTALFKSLVFVENGMSLPRDDIIWGDKSPSYRNNIPLLKRYFPSARFIHIVRDVRDNAISIKKGWHKNPLRSAQRWQDETFGTQKEGARLGDDFIELRFEDLLRQPEIELRRLCLFCEVPFEPHMMQLTETTEDVGSAKEKIGLMQDNFGKFDTELNTKSLYSIERIAKTQMESYGYPLQFNIDKTQRLNFIQETYFRYSDYLAIFLKESRSRGILRSASILLGKKLKR